MKRIFRNFMFALMMGSAVVSCGKDNGGKTGEGEEGGENNEEPEVAGIVIDGSFADWDALSADEVTVVNLESGASKTGIKTVKFYDDSDCIYVYTEVLPEYIATQYNASDKWGDGQPKPFRMIIDTDYSAETGGCDMTDFPEEIDWGLDCLIDSYLWSDGGTITLGWSEVWTYKKTADVGGNFVDNIEQNTALDDVVVSSSMFKGSLSKGVYAVEFAIIKSLVPELGKKVKLCCFLMDQSWGYCGQLPSSGEGITLNLK